MVTLHREPCSRHLWRYATILVLASLVSMVCPSLGQAQEADSLSVAVTDIDIKAFPEARANVQLGGSKGLARQTPSDVSFEVLVDGAPIRNVQVATLAGDRSPTATVLLVDESGSMKGPAIAAGREAAARFLELMGPDDQVALHSFNEQFRVLHGFSSDHAAVGRALSGLNPSKETALYDAVLASLASLDKLQTPGTSRYLIVLSDGGDTASRESFEQVIAQARVSGVQIYTIGLKGEEFDAQPLKKIAEVAEGRYLETPRPDDLSALYQELAAEIHNRFVLAFNLPEEKRGQGSGKLTVRAATNGVQGEGSQGFFYPEALPSPSQASVDTRLTTVPAPGLIDRFVSWGGSRYLTSLILFVLLFIGGYLASRAGFPRRNILTEYADILNNRRRLGPRTADDELRPGERQVAKLMTLRGYQAPLARLIENAGLTIRTSEFALFHLVGAVLVVTVPGLLGVSQTVLVIVGIVAVVCPFVFLYVRANRRKEAFEDQIPDLLNIMANSLRAGQSFEQAMAVVAEEGMEPASTEFRRLLAQQHLGVSPEDSLRYLAGRMDSEAFDWVVMATTIQRQVGGNLAELYQRVAATLRERQRLHREVRTLTAEGRISALILVLLPFAIGSFIFIFNQEYASLLYTTRPGIVMLALAGLGMIAGVIWIRRIITLET